MSMDRRDFIKRVILGGAGLALTPLAKGVSLISPETLASDLSLADWGTLKHYLPPVLRDDMFKSSPFLAYLRNSSLKCSGGTSITPSFFKEAQ